MANLTSVTLTNGVPTVGTGAVSTIDALMLQLATSPLPLPTGGATAALQAATIAALGAVADTNSAPFAGAVQMTVGTTYAAGRTVEVTCTIAGSVVFQFPDGSTRTRAVFVGDQSFPYACTSILSDPTGAIYFNMK